MINFWQPKTVLILILIYGLFFRAYDALDYTVWSADSSRDILIAKHIVEFGEWTNASPDIESDFKLFSNSPIYYYTLAFFYLFTHSAELMIIIFIFLGTGTILLTYWLTKATTNNEASALLGAFFVANNTRFISMSQSVFQPHLLPFLILLIFGFCYQAYKHKSLLALHMVILLSFFSLHLHYSIFLIFPAIFAMIVFLYLKLIKNKKNIYAIVSPLVHVWIMFCFWVWMTFDFTAFYNQETFTTMNLNLLNDNYSWIFWLEDFFFSDLIRFFITLEINNFDLILKTFFLFVLLCSLFILFGKTYMDFRSKSPKLFLSLSLSILIISIIFFQSLYKKEVSYHYSTASYIVCTLIIIVQYYWSTKSQFLSKWITPFLLIIICFNIFFKLFFYFLWAKTIQENNQFQWSSTMADAIYQDRQNSTTFNAFDILQYPHVCQIGSTNLWYFLEEKTNTQLVKVLTYPKGLSLNVAPINPTIETLYIPCCADKKTNLECIEQMDLKLYEGYKTPKSSFKLIPGSYHTIFNQENSKYQYTIYRMDLPKQ